MGAGAYSFGTVVATLGGLRGSGLEAEPLVVVFKVLGVGLERRGQPCLPLGFPLGTDRSGTFLLVPQRSPWAPRRVSPFSSPHPPDGACPARGARASRVVRRGEQASSQATISIKRNMQSRELEAKEPLSKLAAAPGKVEPIKVPAIEAVSSLEADTNSDADDIEDLLTKLQYRSTRQMRSGKH